MRYPCDQCEYAAMTLRHLKQHKYSKHEGLRYPCKQCDFAATDPSNLKRHIKTKHEGIRYPCDQCEYAATTLQLLKQHKESQHEGIRYPCDQCDYTVTRPSYLKQHSESKHKGIRYPCDQCEYAATTMIHLKNHKKSKHEGIKYPCDQCEYTATQHSESIQTSQMNDTASVEMIPLHSAEIEVKKENFNEYNETPVNMENSEYCDLESKIEIVEDMVFKTESSDLSEFLQETNKVPFIVNDNIHDDDLNKKFSNRVTMKEFFPHLSDPQDYMF